MPDPAMLVVEGAIARPFITTGMVSAWMGVGCRRFESCLPDH